MNNKSIKCIECKKKIEWEGNAYRPFCSERCKILDLGAWAQGEYRIAGEKVDNEFLLMSLKEVDDEQK